MWKSVVNTTQSPKSVSVWAILISSLIPACLYGVAAAKGAIVDDVGKKTVLYFVAPIVFLIIGAFGVIGMSVIRGHFTPDYWPFRSFVSARTANIGFGILIMFAYTVVAIALPVARLIGL
jgi:hypothetical protein